MNLHMAHERIKNADHYLAKQEWAFMKQLKNACLHLAFYFAIFLKRKSI